MAEKRSVHDMASIMQFLSHPVVFRSHVELAKVKAAQVIVCLCSFICFMFLYYVLEVTQVPGVPAEGREGGVQRLPWLIDALQLT